MVIAFLSAATFWFFNALNKQYATSLSHPIRFAYNRDSLISVRPLPTEVELDVEGGGWSLIRRTSLFNPNPIEIEIDNPAGKKHLSWIETLPEVREQMGDIVVNQVLQDTLRLQIEPLLEKTVRLKLDSTLIRLEEDHRIVSKINVSSDSITLFGPKSFIDTLKHTFSFQLKEDEIDEDFNELVDISVPDPNLISTMPSRVRVVFSVEPFKLQTRQVSIEKMGFPEGVTFPDRATVRYWIAEADEETYGDEDFSVIADFKSIDPADSTITLILVNYPPDVSDIKVVPSDVKVSLRP